MNDSRQAVFAQECDLIMKGGITSGIVYPLAITEIAKAFRLRSIGGTSAGAIAAAAAAAAELGRQRYQQGQLQQDPAGFADGASVVVDRRDQRLEPFGRRRRIRYGRHRTRQRWRWLHSYSGRLQWLVRAEAVPGPDFGWPIRWRGLDRSVHRSCGFPDGPGQRRDAGCAVRSGQWRSVYYSTAIGPLGGPDAAVTGPPQNRRIYLVTL